jgi:hypothetical protein
MTHPSLLLALALTLPLGTQTTAPAGTPATARCKNVVLVTSDGLRWQELLGGAQNELFDKEQGVTDLLALRRQFWRGELEARRAALMPFFWGVVAAQGQVFASVTSTNGLKFSYPGYHELFGGFAEPKITSNAKVPNPNRTVLEFLHDMPAFAGRIAAFTTWDVFPAILNEANSGILVEAAWEPSGDPELDRFAGCLPRVHGDEESFDLIAYRRALHHVRAHKPRVLHLGFGETDDWGHKRRYDLYLGAAFRQDKMVKELWETLQAMPEYRGQTALVWTTDHGRGSEPKNWTDHGKDVPDAERMWIAVLGPGVQALGVRDGTSCTQGQVAATLAALLGEDWCAAEKRAAKPLPLDF